MEAAKIYVDDVIGASHVNDFDMRSSPIMILVHVEKITLSNLDTGVPFETMEAMASLASRYSLIHQNLKAFSSVHFTTHNSLSVHQRQSWRSKFGGIVLFKRKFVKQKVLSVIVASILLHRLIPIRKLNLMTV